MKEIFEKYKLKPKVSYAVMQVNNIIVCMLDIHVKMLFSGTLYNTAGDFL